MAKGLILDRDGVINVDHGYVHTRACFEWMPGIVELCRFAQKKSYKIAVITNQSGVARGMFDLQQLKILHGWMKNFLQEQGVTISAIYVCPHHPEYSGTCSCRKPGSLMFERAIREMELEARDSWAIGDRERDLIPAKKTGMQTALLGPANSKWADIHLHELYEMTSYL